MAEAKTVSMPYAPNWFELISAKYVRKPHSVSTRILVENENGVYYAKSAVTKKTLTYLRRVLPMGVSEYIPVYLYFVKAVNLKRYSVYACYNSKVKFPLFYITDIEGIGKLYKVKQET